MWGIEADPTEAGQNSETLPWLDRMDFQAAVDVCCIIWV